MSRARDLADLANNASGLETLTVSDITDLSATASELNKLDGVTATTDEINLVDGSVSGPLSHRNMVINGAMLVHQRGGTVNFAHDGTTVGHSLDRYRLVAAGLDQWDGTIQQHSMSSADHNTTGFSKALLLTTGTAESGLGVSEYVTLQQIIEAQNLQHLQYGTASAKSVTLSFWAKTSITGTYAVGLYKHDSTNRVINKTYTVSDTGWNKYTITFPGDTDSGATIVNDNGKGIYINWHLAAGTDYNGGANTSWEDYGSDNTGWAGGHAQSGLITTAGATFYLTGVQLELGTVATPFEHRRYADEQLSCYRYYVQFDSNNRSYDLIFPAMVIDQDDANTIYEPIVPMNRAPDVIKSNVSKICLRAGGTSAQYAPVNMNAVFNWGNRIYFNLDIDTNSLTTGQIVFLAFLDSTTGHYFALDAEI